MKNLHQTGALAAMLLSGGAVVHAGAATVVAAHTAAAPHQSSGMRLALATSLVAPVMIMRGDDDLFHVRVRMDGHEAMAVFDTGASRTVISRRFARRLGLGQDESLGKTKIMRTLGGAIPFQSRKIDALHVEGMPLGAIEVAEIEGLDVPLILGQDAIARFRAVEIRNRRLMLR